MPQKSQKTSKKKPMGRPRRACDKCNAQKIRCVGGLPSCLRCSRLGRTCSYGKVPSKGLDHHQPLSQPDNRPGSRSDTRSSPSDIRSQSDFQPPVPPVPSQPLPASSLNFNSTSLADLSAYCGVPRTLLWDLVEIYFTHAYNANLLLHKDAFVHSLRAGTVTPHVLLGVCAWASKFYKDESGNYSLVKPGFGHEWATRAGSLLFAELVDPREENIVTFINLSLYWYSVGEWRRCYLLKWNAILISYNLSITSAGRDDAARDEARPVTLAVEMSRRRFWSSYLSMNFGSRVEFSTGSYSTALAKVPLPSPDGLFSSGMKDLEKQTDGSVYAELVRGITLWNKISDMVKKTDVPKLTTLDSLHESLCQWWSCVPNSLKLSLDDDETRT